MLGTMRAGALLTLLFLCGCYAHSFPTSNRFILPTAPNCDTMSHGPCERVHSAQLFADANGTFYPTGWQTWLRPHSPWGAGSLLNETTGNDPTDADFRRLIESDQQRQLDELAAFGRNADRIFILVHGYNNRVDQAEPNYRLVEDQLDLRPGDRVIRFYWDGLTATSIFGGKIWFNAVGNSQLVGTRALRAVLNQFHGKTIYLIGHSRGTSVILSALGNPVYDPGFIRRTRRIVAAWPGSPPDLFSPPPLLPNGNQINVIVAAPAVDRIDFCDARMQPDPSGTQRSIYCGPGDLRSLGERVTFRYTVNERDPILRKIIGLQAHFNPTGLGTDPAVGAALVRDGLPLRAYPMPASPDHGFGWYARQPAFRAMLADAGIARPDTAAPRTP